MTLLKSLSVAGLVEQEILKTASDHLSDDVRDSFSGKIDSVIGQAVRTSSGKIRVQLVRDYLWPELSKFIPEVDSGTTSRERLAENLEEHTRGTSATERALDTLKRNQDLSREELSERVSANPSLSNEIQDKANQLSEQLSSLDNEGQSVDKEKQGADIQGQLEKLQSLLDDLKNPEKASGDDLEGLQFKINEIGINEAELAESQLKLLNNLREFCKTTTITYVRTMRFIMEEYKSRNPNFTDEMMQKIILRGHDTPSFTIYGKKAGKDFIENTCSELGIEGFESNDMVLNFNLPDILGRFWYRGGVGAKSQPVPEGAIEWGHFYRSSMPAIWRSIDAAPRKGLFLDRLNAFGQHDHKKYYYLYDVIGLDLDLGERQESGSDNSSAEQETNSAENDSKNDSSSESSSSEETNGKSVSEAGESRQSEPDSPGGFGESGGMEQDSNNSAGQMGNLGDGDFGEMNSDANQDDMQEQLSRMLGELNSFMDEQGSGDNQAIMDALSRALQDSQSGEEMSELLDMNSDSNDNDSKDSTDEQGAPSGTNTGGEADSKTDQSSENGSGQSQGSDSGMQGETGVDQSQSGNNASNSNQGEGSPNMSEQGGFSNQRELSELFSQLQETREKLESSFSKSISKQGGFQEYDIDDQDIEPDTVESIDNLEAIKEQQQRQLESIYREQSGLSGEALNRYIDYREETRSLTDDLTSYFTEKFKMDVEYTYENNQRRGNRLQRGWTSKILGRTALGTTAIGPEIFERRSIPKKPQFVWSVIIDNSASCSGDTIEEEKKTAVALTEVASRLDIPLEIVTFGSLKEYTFLKTFDQELYGYQLSRLVQLDADQGTPDVVTLDAACSSVADYADSFNRPYNFVYFMTDGESGSGSIQSVIGKFKRNMVITGIGLAGAADSISKTWGKNSVEVEDVSKLSDILIRKIEDQIEETFD